MSDQARLQEIHNECRALKIERKELNQMFKDELSHHERYQEVLDEMKALREEKKRIETEVREGAPSDVQRIEEIVIDLKSNEELLSDLAFNLLMNDETVELSDEDNNRYVPQFTVRFKKDGYVEISA